MDTAYSHDGANGVTLDVKDSDATRLRAIANLTERSEAEAFAEAVELLRNLHLPATRPTVVREPRPSTSTRAKNLRAAS